jgi:hypothetical protein
VLSRGVTIQKCVRANMLIINNVWKIWIVRWPVLLFYWYHQALTKWVTVLFTYYWQKIFLQFRKKKKKTFSFLNPSFQQ